MGYVHHRVNYLIDLEPEKAKEEIFTALKQAKMHRPTASEILGVNAATLYRWITRLSLSREIRKLEKLAKKEGWLHAKRGGRPRGAKNISKTS